MTFIVSDHNDFGIDPSFLTATKERLRQDLARRAIRRVAPPASGSKKFIGVLRAITPSANPLKPLALPDTDIARATLGERWRTPVGNITVESDDVASEYLESHMAWIPTRFIADEEITEGITVEVSLTSVSMLNKGTVWFCDEFVLLA